ncbi:hypothetical protein [Emticicia sp.]|uniref:hypothetical protein n=1 Tax=Emticicia sp. TaxID=1930953 RepID=UPI003751F933
MKNIILVSIFLLTIANKGFGQSILDTLRTKAENNQIPTKWNIDLFSKDIKWRESDKSKPLKSLAFPVEKYDTYVFTQPFNFKIQNSNFAGISTGENIGGRENKMIFRHDLCLIFFTKDTLTTISKADVISRNSPYLTFQGTFKSTEQFDFVGVKSPDDKGFLMVSTKAFDLQFGQTVIIFPNENGSFYYLQLTEKPIPNEDFSKFIDRLKSNEKLNTMLNYATKK